MLEKTKDMMTSPDYKERFKAEYLQLKIRIDALTEMLHKYSKGELNFTPVCTLDLLNGQLMVMMLYMTYLKMRAINEKIDLENI